MSTESVVALGDMSTRAAQANIEGRHDDAKALTAAAMEFASSEGLDIGEVLQNLAERYRLPLL